MTAWSSAEKRNGVSTESSNQEMCGTDEGVKAAHRGHIVLQQLCCRGAELSFTRRLRLRGRWRRTRRGVLLCLDGTLERTERRQQM